MKKIKSILLPILFLFPFLASATKDEKKFLGVYFYGATTHKKEWFFCEKKEILEEKKASLSKGQKQFLIGFLCQENIDSGFNIKNKDKPVFISKNDLKTIFKKYLTWIKKNQSSDLYRLYKTLKNGEAKMYKYDNNNKIIEEPFIVSFTKKDDNKAKKITKKIIKKIWNLNKIALPIIGVVAALSIIVGYLFFSEDDKKKKIQYFH